jgi:hypothetical protein
MTPTDRDALERAIAICRTQKTPEDRRQIEEKLEDEPWIEVAHFAAYSCQCDALHLKPWQSPPCWIDNLVATINDGNDGIGGDYAAAKLLQRLLDAGLSRFEPDPIGALERTKPAA